MGRDLFDALARALGKAKSRRNLLPALAAGIAGGWPSPPNPAAARQPRCQKLAKACSRRKKCCRGTRCRRGKCRCPASKQACGRSCIARGACCPAAEERCGDECVPLGACCSDQERRCGNRCLPASDCCTDADCTRDCETGTCQANNQCERHTAGTPCGAGGISRCDAGGSCPPRSCNDETPCPDSDHPCFTVACTNNECVANPVAAGDPLPDDHQIPGDCHQLVCEPTSANGIGRTVDDTDPPSLTDPCLRSFCEGGVPRTAFHDVGTPCDPLDETKTCDADHQCVAQG